MCHCITMKFWVMVAYLIALALVLGVMYIKNFIENKKGR